MGIARYKLYAGRGGRRMGRDMVITRMDARAPQEKYRRQISLFYDFRYIGSEILRKRAFCFNRVPSSFALIFGINLVQDSADGDPVRRVDPAPPAFCDASRPFILR